MSIAEQAATVMIYGSSFNIPKIGFGKKSYATILQVLDKLKNDTKENTLGILPKGVYEETWKLLQFIQKQRFAMKRLLLLWNSYRYQGTKWEGNQEDLIGEPIDTASNDVLSLWDWHSKRIYYFTRDDITNLIYHKIKGRHSPKNPYTNLQFTFPQLFRIYEFLKTNTIQYLQLSHYLKWGGNMLFLVQVQNHMEYQHNVTEKIQNTMSIGQRILLEESYPCFKSKCVIDKEPLYDDLLKECYRLICSEDYDVSYVPITKLQAFLYESFILGGRTLMIENVKEWIRTNRRNIRIKNTQIKKQDVSK